MTPPPSRRVKLILRPPPHAENFENLVYHVHNAEVYQSSPMIPFFSPLIFDPPTEALTHFSPVSHFYIP